MFDSLGQKEWAGYACRLAPALGDFAYADEAQDDLSSGIPQHFGYERPASNSPCTCQLRRRGVLYRLFSFGTAADTMF
ncbi:hypothetical protein NDU88_003220 [Pleurodeles waltl]|uniref:Uncharacterized protein n=1 Tax=Pleurodeles waltl TaxID=8319 RepID=A0AAV7LRG5_PLEWA|nr:hypothetical protein NDU88_003220 [Pleurodeles waltl]